MDGQARVQQEEDTLIKVKGSKPIHHNVYMQATDGSLIANE